MPKLAFENLNSNLQFKAGAKIEIRMAKSKE